MSVTTWHADAGLAQMNEWLAGLRDHGGTEPAEVLALPPHAPGAAPARTPAGRPQASTPTQANVLPQASAPGQARAGAAITERAVIGDQLRRPIVRCEMPSCTSCHADPAALGEAHARARAIGDGWRIDGLGRLACPRCQQTSSFWSSRPVVPWDRDTALVMTTLATVRASRAARNRAEQGWDHEHSGHPGYARREPARRTPAGPFMPPEWWAAQPGPCPAGRD